MTDERQSLKNSDKTDKESLLTDRWPKSPEQARAWLTRLREEGRVTVAIERVEDLVAALEVRQMLTDCCCEPAYPDSGGSYVCGLRKGHEGDHASVWMQDSAERVVRWSGATIRFDGRAVRP